jgi:hypothetical protein
MKLGFFSLLTLIFIVLKLTHVIAWSWFSVLSPLIYIIVFTVTEVVVVAILVARKEQN